MRCGTLDGVMRCGALDGVLKVWNSGWCVRGVELWMVC